MDYTVIAWTSAIQGAIGFLIWIAVRRPIDQLSAENADLRREIKALAEQRVGAIEKKQADHEQEFKALHGRYMSIDDCRARHNELAAAQHEFRSAVINLAKAQESLRNTAAFVKEVNERVIGTMTDIASVKGLESRVERLEART